MSSKFLTITVVFNKSDQGGSSTTPLFQVLRRCIQPSRSATAFLPVQGLKDPPPPCFPAPLASREAHPRQFSGPRPGSRRPAPELSGRPPPLRPPSRARVGTHECTAQALRVERVSKPTRFYRRLSLGGGDPLPFGWLKLLDLLPLLDKWS